MALGKRSTTTKRKGAKITAAPAAKRASKAAATSSTKRMAATNGPAPMPYGDWKKLGQQHGYLNRLQSLGQRTQGPGQATGQKRQRTNLTTGTARTQAQPGRMAAPG